MTGDVIALKGLSAHGFHGVLAVERREGQTFVVDVDLGLDLAPAASSDDLAQTVNYAGLAADVVAHITGQPYDLIETLADRIAASALRDAKVRWARVTVHKPQAPIDATFSDVAVTIERSRT